MYDTRCHSKRTDESAMAYNEELAARIRAILSDRNDVTEKKMFGGIAFMVRGNMACGPHGDSLIVRIGEEAAARAMSLPDVKPMNFTGRVMKTFATVTPPGIDSEAKLRHWVAMAASHAESLPQAKSAGSKMAVTRKRSAVSKRK